MAGRPSQHGPARRVMGRILDWVMGKEAVGKDASGNVYYRWFEGSGPNRTERREVQWVTAYMYYDPNDIPSEWRMWLRKQRDEPPTEEELRQNAAKHAAYQARVAALQEAERLRRLRQQTVGTPDQHAGPKPDMARFLQQMAPGGPGVAKGQPQTHTHTPPGPVPPRPPPPTAAAPQAGEPSAASAGSGAAAGGATAAAEGFKPDTWRPGA